MLKQDNPGCNCCETCELDSDTFDRADSTDIGDQWTESVGDWEIVSNKLKITTTGGIALLVATHDTGSAHIVTNIAGDNDTLARIGVNYVDASNYHFVEVKIHSVASGYLRLYSRVAGTNTLLAEEAGIQVISGVGITVCFANNRFTATNNTSSTTAAITVATPAASRQVFVGSGGTIGTGLTFDNFVAQRGYSEEDYTCEQCPSGCTVLCPDDEFQNIEWEIETSGYAPTGSLCNVANYCTLLNDTVTATFWKTTDDITGRACWYRYVYPSRLTYCDHTVQDRYIYGRAVKIGRYGTAGRMRFEVFGLAFDTETTATLEEFSHEFAAPATEIDCEAGEYTMTSWPAIRFPDGLGSTPCDKSARACVVRIAA